MLRLSLSAVLLVVFWGCQRLQVPAGAGQDAAEDWLMEGASPQRGSAADAVLTPPLQEVWSYNAGAGFGPGSPLLLGETVFVATRKGEVHAIDLETGRRHGLSRFGDAVEGTPVIEGSTLYVPVAWGGDALYAYNLRQGGTRWSAEHAPIEAGLLFQGRHLYGVDVEGTVRAYEPHQGEVQWEHALGERVVVEASPVAAGPYIVVADDAGTVTALRASDGSVGWTRDLQAPVYTSPAAQDDALLIPTTRGRFFALHARSGDVRWHYALSDSTVRFSAPAVTAQEVVFGGSDGVVRSLDTATGTVRWRFDAGEAFGAAPLITRDVIYVGGMDEKLYALDRETGRLLWETELDGRLKSALAFKDGALLIPSENRKVYLFKATDVGYAAHE